MSSFGKKNSGRSLFWSQLYVFVLRKKVVRNTKKWSSYHEKKWFVLRRKWVRITKKSGSYYEPLFVMCSWWCSWSRRKLFVLRRKKVRDHEHHHEPSRTSSRTVTNCHEHITNHHEYYVSFFFVMCSWWVRDVFVMVRDDFRDHFVSRRITFVIVRITFVITNHHEFTGGLFLSYQNP